MANLRGFQIDLNTRTRQAWDSGHKNVMAVLPTGGGKTVCMGDHARRHNGWGVSIAHRKELVGQISKAFAREGIYHSIAAAKDTITDIQNDHWDEFGRSFINQQRADWCVASVDTIISHRGIGAEWRDRFTKATMGIIDEGHHVLRENKWGKAFNLLSASCLGLLLTATPIRADGMGLGRDFDGVVDALVEGPGMRWCIDQGYLTDYEYRGIDARDLELDDVKTTASGELNMAQAADRVKASRSIIGDVVSAYCQFAYGKLGVTFAVDIEEAQRITDGFNKAGVPAELVTAKNTPTERRNALARFRDRKTLMLVNVDLFGEGFDLPAIEIVIMARPTASFSLFAQQWGRALRLDISKILASTWDMYTPEQRREFIRQSNKPRAIIHDHVGNLLRHHGPPDKARTWGLHGTRGAASDAIPLRNCDARDPVCGKPFERFMPVCPHCGKRQDPPPAQERTGPSKVDGDIYLYSDEMLAEMRQAASAVDQPFYIRQEHQGTPAGIAAYRRNAEKVREIANLRYVMGCWSNINPGDDLQTSYRRFYHTFGIDVLAAQALNAKDARDLRKRIMNAITLACYVINDLPFPDQQTDEVAA